MNIAKMSVELSREVMTAFYKEKRFLEEILENGGSRTLLGLAGYAMALLFCIVFQI